MKKGDKVVIKFRDTHAIVRLRDMERDSDGTKRYIATGIGGLYTFVKSDILQVIPKQDIFIGFSKSPFDYV